MPGGKENIWQGEGSPLSQIVRDGNARYVKDMVRVMHAGWCDGGPLAGQRLAHDESRYRLSLRVPLTDDDRKMLRRLAARGVPVEPPGPYRFIDGWYVWDEGAWRWQEPPS